MEPVAAFSQAGDRGLKIPEEPEIRDAEEDIHAAYRLSPSHLQRRGWTYITGHTAPPGRNIPYRSGWMNVAGAECGKQPRSTRLKV
jgi:hypothetical protein